MAAPPSNVASPTNGEVDLNGRPGDLRRGLSVEFLVRDLTRDLGIAEGENVHNIEPRIRDKGKNHRCPRDEQMGAAYVDVAEDMHAGTSNMMLSYTWQYKVSEIVSALSSYCLKHELPLPATRVWICCFCVNQHRVKQTDKVSVDDFMKTFGQRVRSTQRVVGLLSPWKAPLYVTRVWCLFEAFKAHNKSNVTLDFVFPPTEAKEFQDSLRKAEGCDVWKALSNIKVQEADASVEEDKNRILEMIQEEEGGHEALNRVMKEKLCKWFVTTAKETRHEDEDGRIIPEICVSIADLTTRLGDNEASIKFLTSSCDKCKKQNLENVHVAMLLLRLGRAHGTKGDQVKSEDLIQKALAMAERVRGTDERVWLAEAECLRSLAAINRKRGDLESSFDLYKQALQAYQDHKEVVKEGGDHRLRADAGWILLNLGIVRGAMLQKAKNAEAEQEDRCVVVTTPREKRTETQEELQGAEDDFSYFQQALDVYEVHGKTRQPETAWVLRNRGVSYIREGKHAEAKKDFDEAKSIYELLHNTNTENYAELLKSQGILHLHQKEAYARAVKAVEELGDTHRHMTEELNASAQQEQELALQCFEDARKVFMKLVGPHMALTMSLRDLAHLYVERDDLGASQEAFNLVRMFHNEDYCVSTYDAFEGRRRQFMRAQTMRLMRTQETQTEDVGEGPQEGLAAKKQRCTELADAFRNALGTQQVEWRSLSKVLVQLGLDAESCEDLLKVAIQKGFAKRDAPQDEPYLVNVTGFLEWVMNK